MPVVYYVRDSMPGCGDMPLTNTSVLMALGRLQGVINQKAEGGGKKNRY